MSKKNNSLDKLLAIRLRQKRIESGISMKKAAEILNVSQQQYHKYEFGVNRLSAGNLFLLCNELSWNINDFFEKNNNKKLEHKKVEEQRKILKFAKILVTQMKKLKISI